MISVQNLSKTFRTTKRQTGFLGFWRNLFNRLYEKKTAVNNLSFEIKQGELVGFLGPNGAGKTTTLKMLSGILYPSKGKIDVLGFTPFDKEKDFLKQIAFVMGQRNQLLWELPAVDSFMLNKAIYDVPDDEYKETLDELVELLDAGQIINQPVKTLSLGQRMKVELISSLLHRPKVLFLDEPTIGLDVVAQKTIRDFIQEYQNRHNGTILLTSHYMEDVRRLCKRVLIIDNGRIMYDGDLEKLVKKYAGEKIIQVVVDEMPKTSLLEKIGGNPSVEFPKIIFKAKRKNIPGLMTKITRELTFIDITIEEEKIEDIIRKIFQSNRT